jgi:hypothetical protein
MKYIVPLEKKWSALPALCRTYVNLLVLAVNKAEIIFVKKKGTKTVSLWRRSFFYVYLYQLFPGTFCCQLFQIAPSIAAMKFTMVTVNLFGSHCLVKIARRVGGFAK